MSDDQCMVLLKIVSMAREVIESAQKSQETYGDFASMHEGYGVLAEEVDELLDAIRMRANQLEPGDPEKGTGVRTRAECIRAEAIDVAAVALRMAEQALRVTR